jgi:hypothetical protein
VKDEIVAVDGGEILDKLVKLPLATWRYTSDAPEVRHLGPMAEDFRAAFALGASDRTISSMDTRGVALAAVQGLHELVQKQSEEIRQLQARIAELEAVSRSNPPAR